MTQNISKYIQLNDFVLLEYEFSRDGTITDLTYAVPVIATTKLGVKQYYNNTGIGITNNTLDLQSTPITSARSNWYINTDNVSLYYNYFDTSTFINQVSYPHDIVKIHIVSGYNFDDVAGFLLQIRAEDVSSNLVDISNFTWVKQVLGNSAIKFAAEPLYIGNRFYDKYVELLVPSIGTLSGVSTENIEKALNIKALSDVYLQFSVIPLVDNYQYLISEKIQLQLPVVSNADNFNCYISESTGGDYIEYYATWNDEIIGEYMGDIESGRIPLFTSNNPNDNYESFIEQYGENTPKWSIIHELQVYEQIPPNTSLLTQRFQFTQDNNFMSSNKFRPVILNSDIAATYTINYICRLSNRMDGTQIIRQASFTSTNPRKYGLLFNRINVDNYIPYKVFNTIPAEKPNVIVGGNLQKTKYVKVFYDTTYVVMDTNNQILPQGTGPIFLKNGDSTYKIKFEKLNTNTTPNDVENVDLSGVYNYALLFVLDNGNKIEVSPTYSNNMNTTLGELEFKLMSEQINTLLSQKGNGYSVIIKNSDGTEYTFYQGFYFSYTQTSQVFAQFANLFNVSSLNDQINSLQQQVSTLQAENEALKQQS
jgi:hypothetical protein